MRFAVLVFTASSTSVLAWSFKEAFADTPLSNFKINGNELVDLIPEALTSRTEKAVNEMKDDDIPGMIAVAANTIQSMIEHLEDEKNQEKMKDDFEKKIGDDLLNVGIEGLGNMAEEFVNIFEDTVPKEPIATMFFTDIKSKTMYYEE